MAGQEINDAESVFHASSRWNASAENGLLAVVVDSRLEVKRSFASRLPYRPSSKRAGDFPHINKLGPLGRFYRYVLVSQSKAAAVLAEWAITPPPQQAGTDVPSARSVTLYRHFDGQDFQGVRLLIRGDGARAELLTPLPDDTYSPRAEHDLAGLCGVMADLINVQA